MDTTNLDDLLNQAEEQEALDNEWVLDLKYETKDFYVDENGTVEIKNKTIGDMSNHISVKGESYSQYVEFKMNRYYDGIDLTKMTIAIYFDIPGIGQDENRPVNVYYNSNEIKFGWAVPVEVSQVNLTIELCIYVRGILSDGKDYLLKTKTAKYTINDGLEIGGSIIEPTNNWYLNFVLEIDEKVAQASESANRAEQAASSLDGVVETVTTARDEVVQKASTVNTQHSEVESWHQEAEQFRNEAEQFRNEAEAITGIGLAEEGKPGIIQPDGVTTKVDAEGKLIVIGGGSGGGGTTDYQALENKPSIAGVELNGNKSYDDLGLASKDAVSRNFEIVNQNIQELDDYTQSLGEDISALDTELKATSVKLVSVENELQKTTAKVDTIIEKADLGIKETVTGENIHITDSTDNKIVEFSLFGKAKQNTTSGKNILSVSEDTLSSSVDCDTRNYYGDYFVLTATKDNVEPRASYELLPLFDELKGKTIKVKVDKVVLSNTAYTFRLIIGTINSEGLWISGQYQRLEVGSTEKTFTIPDTWEACKIVILFAMYVDGTIIIPLGTTMTVQNPMVYIVENGADDTYEPYTGGQPSPNPEYPQEIEVAGLSGSVEVESCGKNQLNYNATTKTIKGVTFIVNADKSVSVKGTNDGTGTSDFYLIGDYGVTGNIDVLPKGDLIVSGIDSNVNSNGRKISLRTYVFDESGKKLGGDLELGSSLSLSKDLITSASGVCVYIVVDSNTTVDTVVYPMIRLETDTDATYEPYKETTATITTPNGLAGIPVSSGGNYTDQSGQQRICNEIVKYADGSGEYIRRIKHLIADGINIPFNYISIKTNSVMVNINATKIDIASFARGVNDGLIPYMCNRFIPEYDSVQSINSTPNKIRVAPDGISCFYLPLSLNITTLNEANEWLVNNNVEMIYPLAEPIRTPLTAEEIAEIEKLSTFYPVTNISNDFDCGIGITYVVDAKKYIDNKLAQIAAAVVNNI